MPSRQIEIPCKRFTPFIARYANARQGVQPFSSLYPVSRFVCKIPTSYLPVFRVFGKFLFPPFLFSQLNKTKKAFAFHKPNKPRYIKRSLFTNSLFFRSAFLSVFGVSCFFQSSVKSCCFAISFSPVAKKTPRGLFLFTTYCGKFPDSKNVTLSSFSPISSGHKTTISETFVCVLFWVIFMAKHSLASCFSKTIG